MIGRILIPNTSIEVSRLGFGTASLHHQFSLKNRLSLLYKAFEVGMTHFDTAPYYGYGLSEYDLGRFLKGHRSAFSVTTKVGLYPYGNACRHISNVWFRKGLSKLSSTISLTEVNQEIDRAAKSLRESLKRLNTDYVDFLFLHEPDFELLNTDEMFRWMEQEYINGNIRCWGVSGIREKVAPFVTNKNPIAKVIQTRDSIDLKQADFILDTGRCFQFTYGYLSGAKLSNSNFSPLRIISQAMYRNETGSILVSAQDKKHIIELSTSIR